MRVKIGLAAGLVFGIVSGPAMAQKPPPQAANAGFTRILFNSEFANTSLAGQLSCAGTPQTAPWKQGMWWEGRNNPAGVAPCDQINIVYDPVFGRKVLDLEWTASGNHDTYDATSISTFPLDGVSPHFAFRHGYIEVVMRVSTTATGVWPQIYTWGDTTVLSSYPPPYTSSMQPGEFDVMEAWGGPAPELGSHLHEWYEKPSAVALFDDKPATVDVTKPRIYGLLWEAAEAGAGRHHLLLCRQRPERLRRHDRRLGGPGRLPDPRHGRRLPLRLP